MRLKIRDFRGFADAQELNFDRPVVLLCGENHRGKSSTLNAVEWCLFGENCVGKKTGIRERIGWEISNRYVSGEGVLVEVEFKGPEGNYVVTRELSGTGRRASERIMVELPDGVELHGDDAERQIYTLFHSSFQNFMTTVYQHQEAIRAILTQEPRDRNDAIDRLLGLSEYRELVRGMTDAKIGNLYKTMKNEFDSFRQRAEQSIRIYDKEAREKKEKAIVEGMGEEYITEKEALHRAKGIGEAVISLAQELGISDLPITMPQSFGEVAQFRDDVKDKIDAVWLHSPDMVKQTTLERKQRGLATLVGRYEDVKKAEAEAQTERDKFVQQHGDETALVKALEAQQEEITRVEEDIHKSDARASLVREAVQYFREVVSDTEKKYCPLCGAKAPQLLNQLESEWEDKIEVEVRALEAERKERQVELKQLKSFKDQLEQLEKALAVARSSLEECRTQVTVALQREIGKHEDPLALLNKQLQDIASELESQQKAIEKQGEKRIAIFDQLAKLRTIDEILSLERKREIVERIWSTKEYKELDKLIDKASQFMEDVQAIKGALATASREEAEAKIGAAGTSLDKYFCRIANHPTIRGLVMEVTEDSRTGLNFYDIKSKDGLDPTPILSQGDLNCLALSLFFGLAEAAEETQPFAFLMLDDPSQSLGPEMEQQFVTVLEDIAERRQLIISTPYVGFKNLLMTNITKNKGVYDFLDWTEKNGPQITRNA
ncbi:MAG: SMC family ATPase [Dehalococcoidia bacterium]